MLDQTSTASSTFSASWFLNQSLQDILTQNGYFTIGDWQVPINGIIFLIISLLILFVIYRLINRYFFNNLQNSMKLRNISPNVYNAIRLFVRIIIYIFALMAILIFLNIDSEYVLIVASIFTTAIAFASMNAISNFIAGLWIMIIQPFNIGDYIKTAEIEGIVTEISLNYIKIKERNANFTQIPNITCIDSEITNYTLSKSWYKEHIQHLEISLQLAEQKNKRLKLNFEQDQQSILIQNLNKELTNTRTKLKEITQVSEHLFDQNAVGSNKPRSKYCSKDKVVRYLLNIELKLNHTKNSQILDQLCEKWASVFEIKPTWRISTMTAFIVYQIIIYTCDPEDIVEYYDAFVKDIYELAY